MTDFKNLNLSDGGLVALLNFILSMLQEDRKNAMEHHDLLAGMLAGSTEAAGMTTLEFQLLLNDISTALTGFLKNSATSTEQAIKIAKIMADHLSKLDRNASLTEDDREQIEDAIQKLTDEKSTLDNIIDFE